jgi:hypothetical protein
MERCRSVIGQNIIKNNSIWLKGDAVVRVPVTLRPVSIKDDDKKSGKKSRSAASHGSQKMKDLIGDDIE